jgi:hypothetical protein
MCSLVALYFQGVVCPLFRAYLELGLFVLIACMCLSIVSCIFGVRFVCPNSLYVFFVSCSEVSTRLPYVFELAIFAVCLVYAADVVYVCGVILWL